MARGKAVKKFIRVERRWYLSLLHTQADGCMCEHNRGDIGCPVPCYACRARAILKKMGVG